MKQWRAPFGIVILYTQLKKTNKPTPNQPFEYKDISSHSMSSKSWLLNEASCLFSEVIVLLRRTFIKKEPCSNKATSSTCSEPRWSRGETELDKVGMGFPKNIIISHESQPRKQPSIKKGNHRAKTEVFWSQRTGTFELGLKEWMHFMQVVL